MGPRIQRTVYLFISALEKTQDVPGGSHHFTECIVLQASRRPTSLLQQMDESPLFHEIAFEYLQNDLFPLCLTKMH